MKWASASLWALLMAGAGLAADQPAGLPILPCADSTTACLPGPRDLKQAKHVFARALKIQKSGRPEEAFPEFENAARLAPQNVEYLTAREMVRQQLVTDHLRRGNDASLAGRQVEALAEFRAALQLDPANSFAAQRLNDALAEWAPESNAHISVAAEAGEVELQPNPVHADFHYRGDTRGLITQVALAFGITASFDESVTSRRVQFDIQQVDFFTAMRAVGAVAKVFWVPLAEKQILVAFDNPENHRSFDRLALRTFSFPSVSTPQELNDVVNLLRNLFEIKFVTPNVRANTITVRAPEKVLTAATELVTKLPDLRPQVMLDVEVYAISHTLTRNMGLQIPNNFQLFNIPLGALAALGGQNIQDLINQLISSGGINQANSQAVSALLAQLQGQQNSIFSQPLATFGNGLTLMGLSLGTAGAQLSLNESSVKNVQHAMLRVAQGNETTLKIGSRVPILNASFAPIFNSSALSKVIQNNSFQAAFPSFNYEDVGLTLKAKPTVNRNNDVGLQLEMQFRTILGQSFNGVPVIANREYKGSVTLRDYQPAVVAGTISRTEQRSMNGIPGLGAVPGLNQVMVQNSKELDEDELLVVITPRVVSNSEAKNTEVWMAR
jgi:general secretion pathway protein D